MDEEIEGEGKGRESLWERGRRRTRPCRQVLYPSGRAARRSPAAQPPFTPDCTGLGWATSTHAPAYPTLPNSLPGVFTLAISSALLPNWRESARSGCCAWRFEESSAWDGVLRTGGRGRAVPRESRAFFNSRGGLSVCALVRRATCLAPAGRRAAPLSFVQVPGVRHCIAYM